MSLNIQTNLSMPKSNITFGNKSTIKTAAEEYTRRSAKGFDKEANKYLAAHSFMSDIKIAFFEANAVLVKSIKEIFSALKFKPKNGIESLSSNRYKK